MVNLLSVLAPIIATSRNSHAHAGLAGSLSHLPYALTLTCVGCEAILGSAIFVVGLIRLRREYRFVQEPKPSLG